MKKFIVLSAFLIIAGSLIGQDKIEKSNYVKPKAGFYYNEILKSIRDYEAGLEFPKTPRRRLVADLEGQKFPTDVSKYSKVWHNDPISQGNAGTCWCFAGISFLESEEYRLSTREVKLSEMYIVYWEYVERARAFVKKRGDVYFEQGSEAIAVLREMGMHGIVPLSAYPGKAAGLKFHDHEKMVEEMKSFLEKVKENKMWNEKLVVETIKDILSTYMGTPPEKFSVDGKEYTPQTYLSEYLKINPDDYFSFMSTLSQPLNQQGELIEPDNWWHCDDYYNVSMEDFLMLSLSALENGYGVCVCGDVSEPGYDRYTEVGVIPDFDIPSEYISADAREYRLYNKTTTDDHCIHIVGIHKAKNGDYWFMIKDSGSGGFDGPNKGYRFLHEDYICLKMMNVMLYRDAGKKVLDKIIK